ncbi:MAG TPA: PVC-type heme-binding CxxCH protein, partial [Verrucomicrobiae bacterium]|nr:PVC-type heme-binding CxxCH protein [Verrucomicrobiae bacterium]
MTWCNASFVLSLSMMASALGAESDGVMPWRHDQPPNEPYSPQEAIRKMSVPDGFTVELVASEPDIVNPIALSFDDRGRIWITESIEYPRKPAGVGRDRVKIIEDTDADGRADKITVFAEGLNIPTGVAIGYGGVWVLNAPDLLFLGEKDGREASREVVITGFGRTDTHELPNSLTWGPDGWLYGLNGVFNQCQIRSNNGKEYKFNCALWRVHPRTREFQIVSEGTSNPYGLAWDTEGSAIIEACHWANDHLFHFVETGHYQRQAGTFPPFTIPIGSITDHGHQKTAYCGITFLDTDAYPPQFRERIVVGNVHGGALNVDRLQRDGATYLAKGEPDLLNGNDAWFMPVALKIGPDGCLYVLDWYDRYHCSQDAARDPAGVDRLKGRLYRLRYKDTPRAPRIDLAVESDDQLIARLASGNIYFRETAQRILTERLTGVERAVLSAPNGGVGTHRPTQLRAKLEMLVLAMRPLIRSSATLSPLGERDGVRGSAGTSADRKARLHALWALIGTGALEPAFHLKVLENPDPTYRAWGVRAAGNFGDVSPAIREKVSELADDPSPDVQLQVVVASRKIKSFDALPVLIEVLVRCGQDKLIPPIAWNNLHPLLETDSGPFVYLIWVKREWSPAIATLSSRMVERMLSARKPDATATATFIQFVVGRDKERAKECLSIISSKLAALSEPFAAQLKAELKPVLQQLLEREKDTPLFLSAQLLAARLGFAQVDSAAVRVRFASSNQPEAARLQALEALIAFRDPDLLAVLPGVLSSGPPQFIRRAFVALGRLEDPKLAEVVLGEYSKLAPDLQPLAIDLLMQRERWARKLLDAVLANKLPKGVLNANHLRKILESNDREALWAVEKVFGRIREERNPEREKVVAEMTAYFREHIGDTHRGQTVFRNLCAQCHTIYGEGGAVGPDITANGRASFEQLLSNVFDPSLVIGPAYQVTTVVTKDGRNLTGLIAEDNEQRVVVRMPGEGEEAVPRNQVKYTRVSKLSMMPEGIETSLDKKDLADLFAFLSLDRPPTDAGAKLIPGAPDIPKPRSSGKAVSRLKVESSERRLVVRAQLSGRSEWIELATYVMETDSRPYLHPVRDASGRDVLTEDRPGDHPWQHGIFTGFHRVNGFNYWKEDEGKQRFVRLLDLKESSDRVTWRALVELVAPDRNVVLEEEDTITIHAPESPDAYRIDFDLLLRAREKDVTFGKFFVGGLAVRMPWDESNPRQTHLNSNGLRGRACEQQRAAWCNVERPFGSEIFGIAVFDHPANPNHPSGWRADEQGLINPNVSALGDWTLSAKQTQRFR